MVNVPELEDLDEFLVETCEKWNAPGGSVAIVKDNKVVYAKGFGYRDVANKLEWTAQTLQSIGSATKSFTATVIAMMVEDGVIEWDNPIRDYVSEFKLKDPIASNNTTFVDLLGHRTGLPGHYFALMNDGLNLDNILHRLPHLELTKPFRTTFQYCNLLYVVAAKLIEEISGMSYSRFIQKRIFKPLRMRSSVLNFTDYKKFPDHALGYRERNGKLEEIESPASMYDTSSGGGAIFSNAEDIGRWIEFHLNKGKVRGKQIITAESLRKTYHPLFVFPGGASGFQIKEKWWYQSGYGLGWQTVVYRGELMVFHGGSWPGYCTEIRFFPDRNLGVVVYGNKDYAMPFAIFYNIIDRLLGFEPYDWDKLYKEYEDGILAGMIQMEEAKKVKKRTETKPTRPIRDFTGTYLNPGYGKLRVSLEDKDMMIQYGSQIFPLEHNNYDSFDFEDEVFHFTTSITFQYDGEGEVHGFTTQIEPDIEPVFFKAVPDERMRTKEFLTRMVGKYHFMEDTVEVQLKGDDTLLLAISKTTPQVLEPIRGMRFGIEGGGTTTITFIEDESGNITEFQFRESGGFFAQLITAKRIEE